MTKKTGNIIIVSVVAVVAIATVAITLCVFLGKSKKNKNTNTNTKSQTNVSVSYKTNNPSEITSTNNNIVIKKGSKSIFTVTLKENVNEKINLVFSQTIKKNNIFITFIVNNIEHINLIDEWYKDKDKSKIHVSIKSNKTFLLDSKKDFILLDKSINDTDNEIINSIINLNDLDTNYSNYEVKPNKIYNMYYKYIYDKEEEEIKIKLEGENIKLLDKSNKLLDSINNNSFHYILFYKYKDILLDKIEIDSNKELNNVYISIIDDLILTQKIKDNVNLLNRVDDSIYIATLDSNEQEIFCQSYLSTNNLLEIDKGSKTGNFSLYNNETRSDDYEYSKTVLIGFIDSSSIISFRDDQIILDIDQSILKLKFLFDQKISLPKLMIPYFKCFNEEKIKQLFETDNIETVQFNSIDEYNKYKHIFKNLKSYKLKDQEDILIINNK